MSEIRAWGKTARRTGRRLRRVFLQLDPPVAGVPIRTPADFSRAAVGVAWIVRLFYLFSLYTVAFRMDFARVFSDAPSAPLWPVSALAATVGIEWLANTSAVSAAGAAFGVLALLFPGVLPFRAGVFAYLFLFAAFEHSHGAVNHNDHFMVYVAFALLFLPPSISRPPARTPRKDAMSTVMVFWFAQSMLLFSYTLSGFWKIAEGGWDTFAPDALARTMLDVAMSDEGGGAAWLLPFLSDNERVGQALLIGATYCQIFAFVALFRPHLARPIGVAMILFHFGTKWTLDIMFSRSVFLMGALFILSPLAPSRFSALALAKSLPIFGVPFRLYAALRRPPARIAAKAWLIYDGQCPVCANYARFLDVRESVGEFVLINAREGGGPIVDEIRSLPYDLNEGMVLKMNGRHYFGADALNMLALLSSRRGVFGIANRILFASPDAARLGYPLLKAGRRALLRVLGRGVFSG